MENIYNVSIDMVKDEIDWDNDLFINVESIFVRAVTSEDAEEKINNKVHELFPEYNKFYVWSVTEDDIVTDIDNDEIIY